jgi:hypothetical protein
MLARSWKAIASEHRGGRHDVAHANLRVRDAALLHEAHRLLAEEVGRR